MGDEVEILLINDGSTDSHIEPMLKAAETANSCFKYVYKENSGVSMTRNLGIEMAQGKYITFIDADDYLEPDALSYMSKTVECNDADVMMFGFCRDGVNMKARKLIKQRFEVDKEMIQTLISNDMERWYSLGTNLASVWAKVYRREKLLLYHLSYVQDIAPNEDGYFNLCLLSKISAIYVDNTVVYHYVTYAGSAIHKFSNCDLRIGRNIMPRLEVIAVNYGLTESEYTASISCRALKLIISAKRLYFTHPQNPKSFWELKSEMDEFLSEPVIKKWIGKLRLSDSKNKEELKNIVLLKLHLYFIILIKDRLKRKIRKK